MEQQQEIERLKGERKQFIDHFELVLNNQKELYETLTDDNNNKDNYYEGTISMAELIISELRHKPGVE